MGIALGGRLYRAGVRDPGRKTPLGTVDNLDTIEKAEKTLSMELLSDCVMDYDEGKDILSCNIWQTLGEGEAIQNGEHQKVQNKCLL